MASRKGAYNDTRILFKKKGFLTTEAYDKIHPCASDPA